MIASSVFFFLLAAGDAHAVNQTLSSCGNLISNTDYVLANDILDYYSVNDCFVAYRQQNISFDCNGHTVDGTDSAWYSHGFFLYYSSNVTIKNCIITDFGRGIQFSNAFSNRVTNITANSNVNYGIKLFPTSSNNVLEGISASGNWVGIGIFNNFDGSTDSGSNYNDFSDINASGNLDSGIHSYFSIGNRFANFYADNNSYGIAMQDSSRYHFSNGALSNNNNAGIFLQSNSDRNSFSDISATSNNIGVYLTDSRSNYFARFSNELHYSGSNEMFYSNVAQDISSGSNTGWFPPCAQDGSISTSQSNTAWYNGTSGGRNADGTPNPFLNYWFGGCSGIFWPDYIIAQVRPERLINHIGQNFSVGARVRNIGSQNVPPTLSFAHISGNCTAPDQQVAPLAAGEEASVTFTCRCALPNRNSFTVTADYTNRIDETDETNNNMDGVFWCGASYAPMCQDYV